MDTEAVAQAIRFAHDEVVCPLFGLVTSESIEEKSAGEIETVADRECEQLLGPLLRDIIDAPVLGEEAVADDPTLLDAMASWESAWLIDPIDGTASFAIGEPHYAVMVAHVTDGAPVAAWIFQPQFDRMAIAVRGAGSTLNGRPAVAAPPSAEPGTWSGVIKERFLPQDANDSVQRAIPTIGARHRVPNCAGMDYPALVAGEHTFLLYWRTLPWDHAPGVLYATEAGCRALRPGHDDWELHDGRSGLIVAHEAIAATVVDHLLGTADNR